MCSFICQFLSLGGGDQPIPMANSNGTVRPISSAFFVEKRFQFAGECQAARRGPLLIFGPAFYPAPDALARARAHDAAFQPFPWATAFRMAIAGPAAKLRKFAHLAAPGVASKANTEHLRTLQTQLPHARVRVRMYA